MNATKKILFIDDDRDFLSSQSIYFSNRGYKVLTADSTEEALKILETEDPDIMILDLMMEHFDSGFRLSHQIRSNARFKDVPLVMLSGVASATGRRFDQEAEGLKKWSKLDAFLDKPVTARQLLKVIEEKTGAAASGH
ncbi:MAG: response regulator [Deltaproteobacteria bacterium]|nr:response regulator [Deltaproteobacteria bacterium]